MFTEFKEEQPVVCRILSNAILNDRISHAYLFETKGYYRALDLAKAFVSLIECEHNF